MKKFVKLSLAAAVASTGFVSANAGALEDAIKNTSIVGYATIRYDDRNRDDNTGSNEYTQNNTKAAVVLTSKINDNLSYTYAAAFLGGSDTSSTNRDEDGVSKETGVSNYLGGNIYTVYNNFTYTGIANTTVIFGTQALDVPQTNAVDVISGTQEGTGIAAVTTLGPVTLVGGYMNETNIANGDQVSKLGVAQADVDAVNKAGLVILQAKAKVANISLDATYLDVNDIADSFSIGAKTSLNIDAVKVSPFIRYTQMDFDGDSDTNSMFTVGASEKAGIVGGKLAYSKTNKDGGFVAFDTDAEAAYQGWGLQINGNADANMIYTNLNVDVMTGVNVAINYNKLEVGNDDSNEVYGQLAWKPSKNFMAYLRYGQVDYANTSNDGERGRIHVQYTF